MTAELIIRQIGPAATIQDQGRPGLLGRGLSLGGAADPLALWEGAALLGQSPRLAAIEMPGMGGEFLVSEATRFALTGAPMSAHVDDEPIAWNACHELKPGQVLRIGGAQKGVYGYLHMGGGIDTPLIIGARSAHLTAGIGATLEPETHLPLGADKGGAVALLLPAPDRFEGGTLRVIESLQTDRFDPEVLARFEGTTFRRGKRANRMGVALDSEGPGFSAAGQLDILSDIIVPGDIQMTGAGEPYVLLPECQTTGGYPRIASVIPADLPLIAQAPLGAKLKCQFVSRDVALKAQSQMAQYVKRLPAQRRPIVRDPSEISDLLGYQLISGAISAGDEQGEWE